jgi:hypothetical protein
MSLKERLHLLTSTSGCVRMLGHLASQAHLQAMTR